MSETYGSINQNLFILSLVTITFLILLTLYQSFYLKRFFRNKKLMWFIINSKTNLIILNL